MPLLAVARTRDRASAVATPVISYGDRFFMKARSCCSARVLLVQFQRFAEGCPQAVQQFLMGGLLTIYSWDFFNPADPPRTNLFHHRRVVSSHRSILSRFCVILRADSSTLAALRRYLWGGESNKQIGFCHATSVGLHDAPWPVHCGLNSRARSITNQSRQCVRAHRAKENLLTAAWAKRGHPTFPLPSRRGRGNVVDEAGIFLASRFCLLKMRRYQKTSNGLNSPAC